MTNKIFNLSLQYPGKAKYFASLLDNQKEKDLLIKIHSLWLKDGKVPSIQVLSKISGITLTPETVDEGDYLYLIDLVNSEIKKDLALEILSKDDYDIREFNSLYQDKIIQTGPSNIETTKSWQDVLTQTKNIIQQVDKRVSTGFQQFDDMLTKHGVKGWARRYVYLFQGLTGTGKTFFLSNIAVRAMNQSLKIVYVSVEMDGSQVRDLMFRSHFNVADLSLLQAKKFDVDWELTTIVYSNKSKTIDDLKYDINHLSFKPDLVVIDYLDNFLPSRSVQQAWQEHEVIAGDLTRLAQDLDVPVITATQTNRKAAGENGGTKRSVGYEDTGSSFNKTHTMAGIWSIITDDNDYDESTNCRNFELLTNKNREGKQTKLLFTLNYANARLYEPQELVGISQDKFIKQAASGELRAHIGLKKEDHETSSETEDNYKKYYKRLRDNLSYKKEIDQIDTIYLDKHQKAKLKADIADYQKDVI